MNFDPTLHESHGNNQLRERLLKYFLSIATDSVNISLK